jgi:hypothetical protein
MKKTLLLLSSVFAVMTSNGQQRMSNFDLSAQQSEKDYATFKRSIPGNQQGSRTAAKTTAAPRWFSFVDYFDTSEIDISSSIALSAPYLWNDTMAMFAYSGGSGTVWQHNRMVSMGLVVDPTYSGLNSFLYYPGEMKVTTADAYAVDSIRFFGIYGYNPAKTSVVDTIRVAFVYGDGSSAADIYLARTTNPVVLANYGVPTGDSLKNYRMHYDTTTNTAAGTTVIIKDIILDNTGASPAWGDTLSGGEYMGRVGLGTPGTGISIPAGNLIGATLSFISGDPTFIAHDTVFGSTLGYKYNMFRPYVAHKGLVNAPEFVTYLPENKNDGMFKTLPDTALGWTGQYIPLWFWTASGGASTLQYPYIDFRVVCTSCGLVGPESVESITTVTKIEAFPNPASGELNIPFTLNRSSDITITLSNIMGQEVASKRMHNVSSGNVVFNTSNIATGVYLLTVDTDGRRTTGRVSVTH